MPLLNKFGELIADQTKHFEIHDNGTNWRFHQHAARYCLQTKRGFRSIEFAIWSNDLEFLSMSLAGRELRYTNRKPVRVAA